MKKTMKTMIGGLLAVGAMILCATSTLAATLPSGYTQLVGIQSTGTQWINTGIKPTKTLVTECDITLDPAHLKESAVFGAHWSPAGYILIVNTSFYLRFHSCGGQENSVVVTGGRYVAVCDSTGFTINGGSKIAISGTSSDANKDILIFSADSAKTSQIGQFILHGFKMTDGGTLLRDFVPCIDPNGTVGLYDLVSKTFFGNAGSGVFLPVYAVTLDANAADVAITSVTQTPGSGKATVNYIVSGLKTSTKTDLAITASANGKSTSRTIANVGNETGSVEIDYKAALGAAPNVAFSAELTDPDVEGVQLWKDGPYWATCNVGATKPEGNGYYFWWGDTVGYWYPSTKWTSVWNSSTTINFYEAATLPANKTSAKNVSTLTSNGYLDASGNLASWCDAATAYLGAPWRMPTKAEFEVLAAKCTATWTTLNGVKGRLIKGKGDYESKSIFLPAAGYGINSIHGDYGNIGDYWSSTPCNDYGSAYGLQLVSSTTFNGGAAFDRRFGFPIRAVRTFTK